MLKDYTTIKSKNCSTEKFPNLDLVLYNSQVVKCKFMAVCDLQG